MIERLPIQELQERIGEKTLSRLEKIVHFIPNSGIQHPNDIYDKKNLLKIFLSFSGQDIFYTESFRNKLLSRLSDTEIRNLAKRLGLNSQVSFKEIVETISKIPWTNNSETKIIVDFFKLPPNYIPSPKESIPNIEHITKPDVPFKPLKDFQIAVFEQSLAKMDNPLQRFLIQMPTGSGKTRTAMEVICSHLNRNPGKSVIWLANSEELCEQAIECYKDVWSHVGQFDVDIIRAWGSNDLKVPIRSSFIVGGFSKLHSIFKRKPELIPIISKQLVLMVVDEAHQVIAPTYKNVVDRLQEGNYVAHFIGLTATPGRGNITNEGTNLLIQYFAGNKIEIDSGDKTVFEYLRRKKILAHIEKDPLFTNRSYDLTDKERQYIRTHFDFPMEFVEKISSDDVRNIEIINKLKRECEMNKKIILFAGSVDQSKFICATLNFLGFRAEHLDGSTKRDRRRNLIKEFKDGDLNIICNFGVLTTGFDAPKTDVIFIARPTMSVVLYSQMVGRGLRGPAIGGKEKCKLIDVIDNLEVYKSPDNVYDYFTEYWEQNE
ncbi:DEAD/DEAH box helicase [Methanoregula sp.]|jgi:superfamily II DNA or RNA helicase|uniref:DEAD/DEAH box helicase n=1 Tax=Methanoregula sp. TaxID=2052170 RepID=UPI003C2828DC